MKRQEAWLMAGFGVILILLYLLSSTNLIIKERKTEIYPVSRDPWMTPRMSHTRISRRAWTGRPLS